MRASAAIVLGATLTRASARLTDDAERRILEETEMSLSMPAVEEGGDGGSDTDFGVFLEPDPTPEPTPEPVNAVEIFTSDSWSGELISVQDFGSNNPEKMPMVVMVSDGTADYYVGISGSLVTITKVEGGGHSLAGLFSEGESKILYDWAGTGKNLVIAVLGVHTDEGFDHAHVEITTVDPPTVSPTPEPTSDPTAEPTAEPTPAPTNDPTAEPTDPPTEEPTSPPTNPPTPPPTPPPTVSPTPSPTPACTARFAVTVGDGFCLYENYPDMFYDFIYTTRPSSVYEQGCEAYCRSFRGFDEGYVVGFEVELGYGCGCLFQDGMVPPDIQTDEFQAAYDVEDFEYSQYQAFPDPPSRSDGEPGIECFAFEERVVPC